MFKESLTIIQALVVCGITFSWGLQIGEKNDTVKFVGWLLMLFFSGMAWCVN